MTIICICGSTKFKEEFEYWNKEITLLGHIVVSVGCYGHRDPDPRIMERKLMLDNLHKAKIDLAFYVFIIDKDGYIGESTRNEIEYAKSKGKSILYSHIVQEEIVDVNTVLNDFFKGD